MHLLTCMPWRFAFCHNVSFALSESEPQLSMNATVGNIADGDIVTLTCSLKYRASIQLNVHVVITHPGADKIDNSTQRDANEIRSVDTVKVKSAKHTERPTSFGPVQCKVHFRYRRADATEFSVNPIYFDSDKTNASPIISELFLRNALY